VLINQRRKQAIVLQMYGSLKIVFANKNTCIYILQVIIENNN